MAFEPLIYSKTWENSEDFPAYEPNEEQVRADLQLLHDEAKEAINRLVGALNDPSAAAQLPFAAQGMEATTVQEAIEEAYNRALGTETKNIANHSVTEEKLSPALYEKIFGGCVMLSATEPDERETTVQQLPAGQLWICRQMVLKNLLTQAWSMEGGTVQQEDGWVFETDGTQDYLTATQTKESIGKAGQPVLVHIKKGNCSDTATDLELFLNGQNVELTDGIVEAELDQTGSFELSVHGQWSEACEQETICLPILTAVLVQEETLALTKKRLQTLGDFTEEYFPAEMWLKTGSGVWEKIVSTVQPVSFGGTGLSKISKGALLCGTGGDKLEAVFPKAFAERENLLRWEEGTYLGTGKTGEQKLSVNPQVLYITPEDEEESTACLVRGGRSSGTFTASQGNTIADYKAHVSLDEDTLSYTVDAYGDLRDKMKPLHMNREDVTYKWVALC